MIAFSRLARLSSSHFPPFLNTQPSPFTANLNPPSTLLRSSLSTSAPLEKARRWDRDIKYPRPKRTHYDIENYPVHMRRRIAEERAKDRILYNPKKIEPLREEETEEFVRKTFDSKVCPYGDVDEDYEAPEIQQEIPFSDLGLHWKLRGLLKDNAIFYPRPIQSAMIPNVLDKRDVIGISLTGSGKTLAYALPIADMRVKSIVEYQRLMRRYPIGKPAPIHYLVLCPTRELALQVRQTFLSLKIRAALACGGQTAASQTPEIRQTPLLVATPGRLMEYRDSGVLDLSGVRHFVLDEADKMLEMGFLEDVQNICADLPKSRQTVMVSATLPRGVLNLAREILVDPVELDLRGDRATAASLKQYCIIARGGNDKNRKLQKLLYYIHKHEECPRVLVFCNAKREVNSATKYLVLETEFSCHPMHGDLSTEARRRGLQLFHEARVTVLVGTDLVSRGIDFKDVTHVINYDLPTEPETYIHRVGRAARGEGQTGTVINLHAPSGKDITSLTAIEDATNIKPKHLKEQMLHTIFQEYPDDL